MAYNVDIVFVIDGTGSMSPFIDQVKAHTLDFHNDLRSVMERSQKSFSSLRVRVIVYRDYYADPADMVMVQSPFYSLPEQASSFEAFVNPVQASGGGDEPENGLEALAIAIKSDWKVGENLRHVIALWTDASAHELTRPSVPKPDHYPKNMPENLEQLTGLWGQNMNSSGKRLIIYAPDVEPWTLIADGWDNVIHHEARAGDGLAKVDYDAILQTIVNSI